MPLFEDDALEGVIRKAVRGGPPDAKQEDTVPPNEGFGRWPRQSQIPGTGRTPYSTSFDSVKDDVGRVFEKLAREFYPTQASLFDNGQFSGNMIPELHTDILAKALPNGDVIYGYSPIKAGVRTGPRAGETDFRSTDITVAVLHTHWVDQDCSRIRRSGSAGIGRQGSSDEAAIRAIRRRFGDHVRMFVYKWNGVWGEC